MALGQDSGPGAQHAEPWRPKGARCPWRQDVAAVLLLLPLGVRFQPCADNGRHTQTLKIAVISLTQRTV